MPTQQQREAALWNQEFVWHMAVRQIEKLAPQYSWRPTENGRIYHVVTWQGNKRPQGAKIGGMDISHAKDGLITDTQGDVLAVYGRLEQFGGLMHDTQMILICTDGEDITPPPGGSVKVLEEKPSKEKLPEFMQPVFEDEAALSPDDRVWRAAVEEIVKLRNRHSATPDNMKYDILTWQGNNREYRGDRIPKGVTIRGCAISEMADDYADYGKISDSDWSTLGQFVRLRIFGGSQEDSHIVLLATRAEDEIRLPRGIGIEHLGKNLSLKVPASFAQRELTGEEKLLASKTEDLSPQQIAWKEAVMRIRELNAKQRFRSHIPDLKYHVLTWQGDENVPKGFKIYEREIVKLGDEGYTDGFLVDSRDSRHGQYVRLQTSGGPEQDTHTILIATRAETLTPPPGASMKSLGRMLPFDPPVELAYSPLAENAAVSVKDGSVASPVFNEAVLRMSPPLPLAMGHKALEALAAGIGFARKMLGKWSGIRRGPDGPKAPGL
jgi:hypothetical protein